MLASISSRVRLGRMSSLSPSDNLLQTPIKASGNLHQSGSILEQVDMREPFYMHFLTLGCQYPSAED